MNRQNPQEKDNSELANDSLQKGESLYLAVGIIRKPHGVQGEVLFKVLTDFPERIKKGKRVYLGEDYQPIVIASARTHHQGLLICFEGLDSLDAVESLRSNTVYVKSDELPALPAGEYYFHQLIGLPVVSRNGSQVGVLKEILETGANDVYLIESPGGKEILVPAIESVIVEVNLEQNVIVVDPPEWY